MDESEKLAKEYLTHLGFTNIIFEPDGNVPPDFVVDARIAVEVRRLNQNEQTGSGFRGLEETAIPFRMKISKLLAGLGPADTGVSWFIYYTLKRPIPAWGELQTNLRKYLLDFKNSPPDQTSHAAVIEGLEIELHRASDVHATFFLLGSHCDDDSGGWVFGETQKNLRICIAEKTAKIAPVRHKYPEWWLILIDRIGFGVDECDQDLFRKHLNMKHDWNKVILLNPLDPRFAFEVPAW